ncbi:MAG: M61 family metallopeptidase [Bacteroidetes bacterium]|nr:M61 family metallopeptidase [Bacteroidota bacterium]
MKMFLMRIACCALLLLPAALMGQSYNYTLSWTHAASHLYEVSLKTAPAPEGFSDFQIPAWRPGRYYIQDYAAGVSAFQAFDANGAKLSFSKVDANTWRVPTPAAGGEIEVRYQFYANTMDAGSSVLNKAQAYFNPVNFFMHLRNDYARPCTLTVASMPKDWKSATAMTKLAGTHNVFVAPDYHEFVDCPTILSPSLKTLQRRIGDTEFYFHFQGEFAGGKETEDAFLGNIQKVIAEEKAIFGEFPMTEYHFIYQLLPYNMGHAVEHKNSSCFAMPNTVAQSAAAIGRLNSISAHEFFHLWNVKRIRPAAMWPYDYQKENYTTLQWFTEGVTDYYTSLCLARAGLYTRETYFSILARTIQALESNYASQIISSGQSSFDSWLERSDYHAPYAHISYYTLGTRVGLLLDLQIRAKSAGKLSMDDVFKKLYAEYFKQNKGLEEDAVQRAIENLTGQSWKTFFDQYVNGTVPLNYADYFGPMGLELEEKPLANQTWELLGIEKSSIQSEGLLLESVRPGTDAAMSGLGDDMLILKVNGKDFKDFDAAKFFAEFKKAKELDLEVASEAGMETVKVTWTGTWVPKTYALAVSKSAKPKQSALLEGWLKSRQ